MRTLLIVGVAACGDDGGGDGSSGDATETSSVTSSEATSSSASTSGSASTSVGTGTDPSGETTSEGSSSGSGEASSSTSVGACELGGEWVVVDDFVGVASSGDAQARGSVVDPDGRVFVGGAVDAAWTVRRSEDGGASWETADTFQLVPGMESVAGEGVVDADGGIWIVGSGVAADGFAHRVVRRSTDAGASWETVDDWHLEDGYDTYVSGMAIAPDDSVWTVGQAGASTSAHWTVRRGDDGGESWSTDDDWQLAPGHLCLPRDVTVDEEGVVYVVGNCEDATPAMHWIVRRREPSGTWATIDDYQPGEGYHAGNGVTTRDGRVVVVGSATIDASQHWIVRARVGAEAWSTLDDIGEVGVSIGAAGVYDDGEGTVVVAGTRNPGTPATLTRRSDDDGVTWTTIDEFDYEGGGIYGGHLSSDADGNLYSVGIGLDRPSGNHWIVRRMGCE